MSQKKLDQKIKKLAKQYVKRLRESKYPVVKAFVFGSRVRGNARNDSDVDVAIISPRVTDPVFSNAHLLRKAHEYGLQKIDLYIEPHGFNPDDFVDENPLVWEIKQTGVPVG